MVLWVRCPEGSTGFLTEKFTKAGIESDVRARGRQWDQKLKPEATWAEMRHRAVGVISQISCLKLKCRGISGLHFCFSKNFCTLPLGKDNWR